MIRLLCNLEVLCDFKKSSPLKRILEQLDVAQTLTLYFFTIPHKMLLPMHRSSNLFLPFRFSYNILYAFLIPLPCASSFSLLQLRYIYLVKSKIHFASHYGFSSILYHFLPLRSKHSPLRTFVEPTKVFI
jgi:hypothetical protein